MDGCNHSLIRRFHFCSSCCSSCWGGGGRRRWRRRRWRLAWKAISSYERHLVMSLSVSINAVYRLTGLTSRWMGADIASGTSRRRRRCRLSVSGPPFLPFLPLLLAFSIQSSANIRQESSSRNTLEHLGASWSILEHLGASWNISEHSGASQSIPEHL